jgi:HEAT repeat protein
MDLRKPSLVNVILIVAAVALSAVVVLGSAPPCAQDERAVVDLIDALDDPDADIRALAAELLPDVACADAREAMAALAAVARNPSEPIAVRLSASRSLGRLQEREPRGAR